MRSGIVAWLVLAAWAAGGCSTSESAPGHAPAGAAPSATAATAAAAQPAGEGPCALLTVAEVRSVFPEAGPGKLDSTVKKYGVRTCVWNYPTGRFSIIDGGEETISPREEAAGWTAIFVDPLNAAAESHVRYEVLEGVGDEAVAVVEAADKAKGFYQHGALLVVRRGTRQVTLMSTDLARRPRAEALAALRTLGQSVAKRM
jgi:hypothetical protein